MRANCRRLLIAGTSCAVLVVVFFVTRSGGREEQPAEAIQTSAADMTDLVGMPGNAIRKIEVENPDGGLVLSSMDGESWLVAGASAGYRTEPTVLQTLVNAAAGLKGRLIETGSMHFGTFGLDEPAATIRVIDAEGRRTVLRFGDVNPAGNGRYVAVEGRQEIYLAPESQAAKAFWTPQYIRSRKLPDVPAEEIISIMIRSGGQTFRAEAGDGELDPYRPLKAPMVVVEPWSRPRLIDQHAFFDLFTASPPPSRIADFVDETDGGSTNPGFGPESDRIRIATSSGQAYDLEIGASAPDGRRYCREASVPASVILIDPADLGLLEINPFAVSDHFVFLAGIDRVREVRIRSGTVNRVLSIEKKGDPDDDSDDIFRVDGIVTEEKPFKELYQLLIGLVYEGVAGSSGVAGETELVLEYEHSDRSVAPVTVQFVGYDDTFYRVWIDGRPEDFLIGRYQVNRMLQTLDDGV